MKPSILNRFSFAVLWFCVVFVALLALLRTAEIHFQSEWEERQRQLYTHYGQLAKAHQHGGLASKNIVDDWWQAEQNALAAEQQLARLPVYRANSERAQTARTLHSSLQDLQRSAPAAESLRKRILEAMQSLQDGWQSVLDTALRSELNAAQRPEVMAILYAQSQGLNDLSRLPAELWMSAEQGGARLSEAKRRLELSQTSFDALLVGNPRLRLDPLESSKVRQSLAQLREPMQVLARRLLAATEVSSPIAEYWSLQRTTAQQLSELTDQRRTAVPVMPTWAAIHQWLMPLTVFFAVLALLLAYALEGQKQRRLTTQARVEQQQRDWQQQLVMQNDQISQIQQTLQSVQHLIQQLRSRLKPLVWPAWPEPDPVLPLQALYRQAQEQAADASMEIVKGDVNEAQGSSQVFEEAAQTISERLQTLHLNLSLEAARQPALADLVGHSDSLLMQWREIAARWQQQAAVQNDRIEHLRGIVSEQTGRLQRLLAKSEPAARALDDLREWQRTTDKRRERNLLLQQLAQQLDQCSEQIQPWLVQEGES